MPTQINHSPLPWTFTYFSKPDGSDIKTPQDVADTVAYSSLQCGGETLWGVTLDEKDEEGRTLVICYTGNGPHSEDNARLIVAAVNALNITQPAKAVSPSLESRDRTPQDYAIEHAEYLAKAVEGFLEALGKRDMARDEADSEELNDAEMALSDHWNGLQTSIYEFRKRAFRAAPPAAEAQPHEERGATHWCTSCEGLWNCAAICPNCGDIPAATVSGIEAATETVPQMRSSMRTCR